MRRSDVRLLFSYDRWATARVLNTAEDMSPEAWAQPSAVGDRSLGGILVHALGAHARWRNAWHGTGERPRPEDEPLPTVAELRGQWVAEWDALDAYLASLDEGAPDGIWDGLPLWQPMVHVVNHGTQHRSEAAVILTGAGHSPGELDFIDFLTEAMRG